MTALAPKITNDRSHYIIIWIESKNVQPGPRGFTDKNVLLGLQCHCLGFLIEGTFVFTRP